MENKEEIQTTTIRIDLETKSKLDSLKIHPRQSYDEVLNNIISNVKEKTEGDKSKGVKRA